MIFSESFFLFLFLPLCLLLFLITPRTMRKYVVCSFSTLFIASYSLKLFLIFFLPFLLGNFLIYRLKLTAKWPVLFNILILVFFKYSGILSNEFDQIKILIFEESLFPLGLSFVVFQLISFFIDREREEKDLSFLQFYNYFTFFPQMIAGPICRKSELEGQIKNIGLQKNNSRHFLEGILIFLVGAMKKVIIADNIGRFIDPFFENPSLSELSPILCVLAYSFQIYFDFSGYSDMAVGLGRLFGIQLPENFNDPFKSASFTEFWKRWHITLNTFFYDYVYLPLMFYKRNNIDNIKLKTGMIVLIVFCLSGAWHGPTLNYLFFGLYHAILLLIEITLLKKLLAKNKYCSRVFTFAFCTLGFLIFRSTDLTYLSFTLENLLTIESFKKIEFNFFFYFLMIMLVYKIFFPFSRQYLSKAFYFIFSRENLIKFSYLFLSLIVPTIFMLLHYISASKEVPFIYFAF